MRRGRSRFLNILNVLLMLQTLSEVPGDASDAQMREAFVLRVVLWML